MGEEKLSKPIIVSFYSTEGVREEYRLYSLFFTDKRIIFYPLKSIVENLSSVLSKRPKNHMGQMEKAIENLMKDIETIEALNNKTIDEMLNTHGSFYVTYDELENIVITGVFLSYKSMSCHIYLKSNKRLFDGDVEGDNFDFYYSKNDTDQIEQITKNIIPSKVHTDYEKNKTKVLSFYLIFFGSFLIMWIAVVFAMTNKMVLCFPTFIIGLVILISVILYSRKMGSKKVKKIREKSRSQPVTFKRRSAKIEIIAFVVLMIVIIGYLVSSSYIENNKCLFNPEMKDFVGVWETDNSQENFPSKMDFRCNGRCYQYGGVIHGWYEIENSMIIISLEDVNDEISIINHYQFLFSNNKNMLELTYEGISVNYTKI